MDNLLTVQEAATLLRLSPCTVYRLVQKNQIPFVRKPFGLRFCEDELTPWLNRDLVKPIAPLPTLHRAQGLYGSEDNSREMAKSKKKGRFHCGFGSVYERRTKTGIIRWAIDYRDPTGKRVQKVIQLATSREEAFQALREELRREFDHEYRAVRERERINFARLTDMYIEDYAKANKKSWQDDLYRINAHLNPFFGTFELKDITPLQIEKYRAERLKTGVTRSTINRETTILKRMFNLAIDWELTDMNPVVKIKLFSEKDTMKERILKPEEEVRLLAACPTHLRPIVIVALHTGMRRGEILDLRWKQVDLERGLVRVENTKSGKNRLIPINGILLAAFRALRASQAHGGLVFANPRTCLAFTEVKKSFKSACRTAGIKDLRFHDLRHTFATRLIEAGADIITVKELLGHFSVRVTQRYTHPSHIQKRLAVDLLARKAVADPENRADLLLTGDAGRSSENGDPVNCKLSIN